MRTRILNKMTANEVEKYLADGGNTIFVAVGVVEMHGPLPLDVETIVPEAFAVTMAEKADGLALINLPYFFPGGTIVSPGTVHVSVRESIDYLMMLSRSLVAQGFRKIFFISAHGPADLYVDAMCRDFFQETKIHVCHLHPSMYGVDRSKPFDFKNMPKSYAEYGAYKIMGQMEVLPIDPDAPDAPQWGEEVSPIQQELSNALRPFGGKTSIYYTSSKQHGGGRPFHSEEERLEICTRGEKEIRDLVDKMDLERLKNAVDAYHAHVQEIIAKNPRLAGKY